MGYVEVMRPASLVAMTALALAAPDDASALRLVAALLDREASRWGAFLQQTTDYPQRAVAWRARHLARAVVASLPAPDAQSRAAAEAVRQVTVVVGGSVLGLAVATLHLLAAGGPCAAAAADALDQADDARASLDGSIVPEEAVGVE